MRSSGILELILFPTIFISRIRKLNLRLPYKQQRMPQHTKIFPMEWMRWVYPCLKLWRKASCARNCLFFFFFCLVSCLQSSCNVNISFQKVLLEGLSGKEEMEQSLEKLEKDLKEACRQRDKALQQLNRLKQHLLEKVILPFGSTKTFGSISPCLKVSFSH